MAAGRQPASTKDLMMPSHHETLDAPLTRWPARLALAFLIASTVIVVVGAGLPLLRPDLSFSPELMSLRVNLAALAIVAMLCALTIAALRGRVSLLAILAVAVIVRLALLPLYAGMVPGGDGLAYLSIAREMVENHQLRLVIAGRPISYAVFPPTYSLALALPMALGLGNFASCLLVNALGDLIAAGSIAAIARELGLASQRSRLIGALTLLWPPLITAFAMPQKESLGIGLALLMIYGFVRARRQSDWKIAALIGVDFALLALCQPAWGALVVPFGLLLLYWRGFGPTLALALRAIPFALMIFAPWWIRNYMVFGQFIPISNAPGLNLYFVVTNSYPASEALLHGRSETEANALGLRLSWQSISSNTPQFLRNQFITLTYSWILRGWHGAVLSASGFEVAGALVGRVTQFATIAMMALAATAAARRLIGNGVALLYAAAALGIIGFNMWFELGERHLFPLMPLLFLAVAMAWSRPPELR